MAAGLCLYGGDILGIDFNALKVPVDKKIKVTQVLSTINVGKPSRTAFFQVRSDEGFESIELFTYAPEGVGKDHTPYLVMPACQSFLQDLEVLFPAKFYMYIIYGSNILKVDFISQKTDKFGNLNRYHASRMEAYEVARTKWVRMYSNQEGGFYSYAFAEDILDNPIWPKKPENLQEAIEIAFKGFVLDSMDHPIIKKLRGKL